MLYRKLSNPQMTPNYYEPLNPALSLPVSYIKHRPLP
jgi:hypothetical protein